MPVGPPPHISWGFWWMVGFASISGISSQFHLPIFLFRMIDPRFSESFTFLIHFAVIDRHRHCLQTPDTKGRHIPLSQALPMLCFPSKSQNFQTLNVNRSSFRPGWLTNDRMTKRLMKSRKCDWKGKEPQRQEAHMWEWTTKPTERKRWKEHLILSWKNRPGKAWSGRLWECGIYIAWAVASGHWPLYSKNLGTFLIPFAFYSNWTFLESASTSQHPISSWLFFVWLSVSRGRTSAGIFVWLSMIENSLRFAFLYLKPLFVGSKSNPAILQTIYPFSEAKW